MIFVTRRHLIILIILAVLYAVTWVGGWITYERELKANTQAAYDRAVQTEIERAKVQGGEPNLRNLHKGGPVAEVDWCFPLLPGVLVVHSEHSTGPQSGTGGVKLVLYWGIGTAELVTLYGWQS
jgi:hypothetical protein